MLTREQLDEAAAVVILYHWACGEMALYVPTGEYKTLEI